MGGLLTSRQSNVAKLRGMGLSVSEIADSLELEPSLVDSTLKTIYSRKVDENRIVMAREVELDRCEQLYEAYEESALKLNKDAAQMCLAIHDRKSKLLGLEAPKAQQAPSGPQVTLNFNFGGEASGQSHASERATIIEGVEA